MVNLQEYKNGNSVKVVFTCPSYYVNPNSRGDIDLEVKGLLYKPSNEHNRFVLFCDRPLYNQGRDIPNVIKIEYAKVKSIGGARFPKEVSELLHNQYDLWMEDIKLQAEIERLSKKKSETVKSIVAMSKDITNVCASSNLNDEKVWTSKIRKDFEDMWYQRRQCGKNDLHINFKGIEKTKGKVQLVFNFSVEYEEQILSKELEDRIRRDEHITKDDITRYTPSAATLKQKLQSYATLGAEKTSCNQGDKGWVTFANNVEAKFDVNLEKYDSWRSKFMSYIDSTFPCERY